MEFDITSDLDVVIRDTGELSERQLPFAMAGAVLDTAFDVRQHVVGVTYPNAFDVKNRRFPGVLFKVTDGADTPHRGGAGSLSRDIKATGVLDLAVQQVPLPSRGGGSPTREYIAQHATGGTKTPRGSNIAVPVTPSDVRGASGRVLARNKPVAIEKRKDHFLAFKGGRKFAVMRRNGDAVTAVYLFIRQANISKSFRFYEDSMMVTLNTFPGHLDTRWARAVRSSRFR